MLVVLTKRSIIHYCIYELGVQLSILSLYQLAYVSLTQIIGIFVETANAVAARIKKSTNYNIIDTTGLLRLSAFQICF